MSDPIELRWQTLTEEFLGEQGVTLERAFGRMSLMVDGRLFASAGPRGLLIRVSAERVAQLIRLGDAGQFRSGAGRVMREWAVATPESDWSALAAEALEFVADQAAEASD
ncbi:hypothetical protein BH10ACT6_BH10ACT6_09060 [soil metagenome]